MDYNLFEEIVKERDQIRERPEHLSYNAKGGRVGLAFGGIPDAVQAVDVKEKETITESLGGGGGEAGGGIGSGILGDEKHMIISLSLKCFFVVVRYKFV